MSVGHSYNLDVIYKNQIYQFDGKIYLLNAFDFGITHIHHRP